VFINNFKLFVINNLFTFCETFTFYITWNTVVYSTILDINSQKIYNMFFIESSRYVKWITCTGPTFVYLPDAVLVPSCDLEMRRTNDDFLLRTSLKNVTMPIKELSKMFQHLKRPLLKLLLQDN
jgi:hypothetical protein